MWKPRKQKVIFQKNNCRTTFSNEEHICLHSKKLIYASPCFAWKTFKEVTLQLLLGAKTNCVIILWKHSLSCLFLPDIQKVYAYVYKLHFGLPKMVTRNGFEPKTLSAMPRLLSHVSVQTHPSVLERAWYELLSIPLEMPVEIFCTKLMFLIKFQFTFL